MLRLTWLAPPASTTVTVPSGSGSRIVISAEAARAEIYRHEAGAAGEDQPPGHLGVEHYPERGRPGAAGPVEEELGRPAHDQVGRDAGVRRGRGAHQQARIYGDPGETHAPQFPCKTLPTPRAGTPVNGREWPAARAPLPRVFGSTELT
jgi:hypothetical protein